VEGQVVS
jgi:hypothetical protein